MLGLSLMSVSSRIRDGWNPQDAINKPIRPKPTLTEMQRQEIRAMTGITQQEIGRKYGITQAAVSEIKLGRRKRSHRKP